MTATPAQLYQIARDERARRMAAWKAAGKTLSDRAQQDDIIWSNIVHLTGREAGDPTRLARPPWYWTTPERIVMARSVWTTACKMEGSDTIPAEQVRGMFSLYRHLRPIEWSPFTPEAAA